MSGLNRRKRDRRGKYRRVFERYDFPYDSESVQEIFSNVNPDLVLFLGAYDTNYDCAWRGHRVVSASRRCSAFVGAARACSRQRHRRPAEAPDAARRPDSPSSAVKYRVLAIRRSVGAKLWGEVYRAVVPLDRSVDV